MYDSEAISKLTVQKEFAEQWKSLHPSASVVVLPTIQEALDHARSLSSRGSGEPDVRVLVTGSLHLVGGAIGVLEGIRS
jgi:folylpolyglutamate synthase